MSSVAGTQTVLNDPNFIAFPNARWRVQTNWGIGCNPSAKLLAEAVTGSKSNIRNNDVINTGLSSVTKQGSMLAYPNPAANLLTLSCPDATHDYKVQLFNTYGQLVFVRNCEGTQTSLSLSAIANGIYYLQVSDAKGYPVGIQKIVVAR